MGQIVRAQRITKRIEQGSILGNCKVLRRGCHEKKMCERNSLQV